VHDALVVGAEGSCIAAGRDRKFMMGEVSGGMVAYDCTAPHRGRKKWWGGEKHTPAKTAEVKVCQLRNEDTGSESVPTAAQGLV
jgi:hypothetical protein